MSFFNLISEERRETQVRVNGTRRPPGAARRGMLVGVSEMNDEGSYTHTMVDEARQDGEELSQGRRHLLTCFWSGAASGSCKQASLLLGLACKNTSMQTTLQHKSSRASRFTAPAGQHAPRITTQEHHCSPPPRADSSDVPLSCFSCRLTSDNFDSYVYKSQAR